ncbi:hypothetical protein K443DRAFT_671276 [Laccaria amethystina LaAM-08-1]|uniref:Uncharacterized protein n=1 Tax=Laccaria amethystina LaAM-08-1 TaxID=1095629 RepID=A0A0C9XCJ0_9AGAR|nr:hypothetical protein K443DRAFT_671276 [Laccaria amethystina LaAM-08-1]
MPLLTTSSSSAAISLTRGELAVSSSEAASLGGKKAKTPIIAGSVCGSLLLLAWIIGFAVYIRKLRKRTQRNRLIAAGEMAPREKDVRPPAEKVVILPDPAVLLGQRKPGEHAFPEREHSKENSCSTRLFQHETNKSATIHPSHASPLLHDESVVDYPRTHQRRDEMNAPFQT